MIAGWRARWQALAPREQRMVLLAAGCAVAALVYALAVEPAWRDRARLLRALPELQSQALEVDALRRRAEALRGEARGSEPPAGIRAAAEQSLGRAGLSATVTVAPDGSLGVAVKAVSAQAWFGWVEGFARDARLRVVRVHATRAAAPGRVDAEAQFAASGG